MIETITPLTLQGRSAWRITHYPHDQEGVEFDLYDVDAATFSPIRSVTKNKELELSLSFGPDYVLLRRKEDGNVATERITLDAAVKPEGPGHRVFIARLPLIPGYMLKFRTVDRWSGKRDRAG